eukprot:GHVS01024671.1.p1 GENE.GHVS01024671.1~~GHVS01024671.1.p1  ORF type:complete len:218 (+),score=26.77 GHVS01024671.1:120-773(+)
MEALCVHKSRSVSPSLEPAIPPLVDARQSSVDSRGGNDEEDAPHGSDGAFLETETTVTDAYADGSALPTVGQLSPSNVDSCAAATAATSYQTGMYSGFQQPQTATFLSSDGSYLPTGGMLAAGQQSYTYGQNIAVAPYAAGPDGAFYSGGRGPTGMAAGPMMLPNGQIPMYFNPSTCGYDQSSGGKDPRKGYPLVYPYVPLQKQKREKPLKKRTGCC